MSEPTCEVCGLVTRGDERVADTMTDHLTDSDCVEAMKRERVSLARRVAELEAERDEARADAIARVHYDRRDHDPR